MPGPLASLKILDFSTLLPGPFASLMLADLGADVLSLVSGSLPDLVNEAPPMLKGGRVSALKAYLGRGKKSLTLNLKHAKARDIIHALLKEYDIILEQFRPGVMERLGFSYGQLKKTHPDLIYCSITGYGQEGPMALKAGHDINYQARSGVLAASGGDETGPVPCGTPVGDLAGGSLPAVIGILAAVIRRKETGRGCHVDIAMNDCLAALNPLTSVEYLATGRIYGPGGHPLSGGGSLYGVYRTKDGRYISLGALEPKFFSAFCDLAGLGELKDQGYDPPDLPTAREKVRRAFLGKTLDEWMELARGKDICLEPVMTLNEVFDSEAGRARGLSLEVSGPEGETVRQPAQPIKMPGVDQPVPQAGVAKGADNRKIMTGLGYSPEQIEKLHLDGLFD